jgi:hypothetical protein
MMRLAARIGVLACLAILSNRTNAFAGDEDSLLNGRYSFVLSGTGGPNQDRQVARVGTLAFDGKGNVTDVKVRETVDASNDSFPSDTLTFAPSTYWVVDGFGYLTFKYVQYVGSIPVGSLTEVWWIRLTDGGKGFYITVMESSSLSIFNENPVDAKLTVSGEARAKAN